MKKKSFFIISDCSDFFILLHFFFWESSSYVINKKPSIYEWKKERNQKMFEKIVRNEIQLSEIDFNLGRDVRQ